MFPDPQDAIKLEKKPLNPELQTSVNKMVFCTFGHIALLVEFEAFLPLSLALDRRYT